jgi:hypothetical protein
MDARGYYEVELSELIEFCGGRGKIFAQKNPRSFMVKKHQEFIDSLFDKGYDEIGELHMQSIDDYVDWGGQWT